MNGESGVLVGLCRGSHQRWVPTAGVSFPHRHDWALPRLSGLTAPQTVDDPGVVRRGATRARVDMFAEDQGSVLVSKA